jgi:HD-GYP domain-containing protein (c-di-GMP phosphodiesterase class II)
VKARISLAVRTADAGSMHRTFERGQREFTREIDHDRGAALARDDRSARTPFGTDVKDALLQLLTAQNESLVAHLAQVAELATRTAVILGLSPAQVRLTRLGAELHDVGKVGIPASILDKAGPLNAEEQWFMQRHSEIGERIIEATPSLKPIAPIVRAVHERPDGNGYPDGLKLAEIPIPSRVIAVVDAFDAMTHDRPYQEAMPAERALAELRLHAGTQFDPAIVEAFACAIAELHAARIAA